MDTSMLTPIIAVLFVVIMALALAMLYVSSKNKKAANANPKEDPSKAGTSKYSPELSRAAIEDFMEFEEIKDSMIIRKDRKQYVMVMQCQGVNYDLLSEEEKISVEEGFVQFLNILRFPIQLYVQTRSLNLRDIIEEYRKRINDMQDDLEQIRIKLRDAQMKKNDKLISELKYQEKRKKNILDYTTDITEYVSRLSLNNNVLQQKTYVIVSYYISELGSVDTYSKEEIDSMCFSELYTRSQSLIRSLATSSVNARVLNSEELAELLYVAYNRDDEELIQLSRALDAEYDSLYNIGKDVLEKKKLQIEERLDIEAAELASQALVEADDDLKKKREEIGNTKKVEKRAMSLVEQYRDNMSDELYKETKEKVVKKINKKRAEILQTEEDNLSKEQLEKLTKRRIGGKRTI